VATRLTLRMDERLIETAKRHAAARETSVSRMVAAYFEALDALSAGGPLPGDLPVPSRQHNAPRAPGARPQARTLDNGDDTHSFATLLADLATIQQTTCREAISGATFPMTTTPTAAQQHALDLLDTITV
jgi:hypothetical protein